MMFCDEQIPMCRNPNSYFLANWNLIIIFTIVNHNSAYGCMIKKHN